MSIQNYSLNDFLIINSNSSLEKYLNFRFKNSKFLFLISSKVSRELIYDVKLKNYSLISNIGIYTLKQIFAK